MLLLIFNKKQVEELSWGSLGGSWLYTCTVQCNCTVVSQHGTTMYDIARLCRAFLNVLEYSRTYQLEFWYGMKEKQREFFTCRSRAFPLVDEVTWPRSALSLASYFLEEKRGEIVLYITTIQMWQQTIPCTHIGMSLLINTIWTKYNSLFHNS